MSSESKRTKKTQASSPQAPKNVASTAPVSPSPATSPAVGDPGDDTQRNFRYQHAYGVMLLLAGASGDRPYAAIFCEHHEDVLAERTDGRFDAYQIKTRRPENGDWQLNHEALQQSVRRFVGLDGKFAEYLGDFFFVSNASFLETTQETQVHLSPTCLLNEARASASPKTLTKTLRGAFDTLRGHCMCDDDALWNVLKRLRLLVGPSREDFGDVVAHSYLPKIKECQAFSPARLNNLRDELIDLVYRASAKAREDPARHVLPMGPLRDQVRIRAKRILVTEVLQRIRDVHLPPFRYTQSPEKLTLAEAQTNLHVLDRKLIHAGLQSQIDTLRRRALGAEQYLIEKGYESQSPSVPNAVSFDHAVTVVKADCDEALIRAKIQTSDIGPRMLVEVHDRLHNRADSDKPSIDNLPYEVLVGIAALLTGECKIWWGDPFDLSKEVA